ncbi:MAG: trehalose-phosphatase [Phycisphaerae bacterium]|nr:trehalose-phosphatase [Phycisphaerae bacterium]
MNQLEQAIEQLARTPVLLVASDYDGTIAPIVDDPEKAVPDRCAIVAIRSLAQLRDTHVSIISGRSLSDLDRLTRLPASIHLVGSHGSEFEPDFAGTLLPSAMELRTRIEDQLTEIADDYDGISIEAKPASVALHYRKASEKDATTAVQRVKAGPARLEGVVVKEGKMVIELSVVSTNKGDALETLRHRFGATAVLYIGDDVTDEDAFRTLSGPDVGVKVGEGDTTAAYRVDTTEDAARLLASITELRNEWMTHSACVPIEQHTMLSDERTIALVTPDARITWMCAPRIDSPAIFAELLGGPSAGFFAVTPLEEEEPVSQEYDGDSLAMKTRWKNLTLTDFLDCSGGRPAQRAGRSDLIRIIEGSGKVQVEFCPRPDFGRLAFTMEQKEGGLAVDAGFDPVVLHSPGIKWDIEHVGNHCNASAVITVEPGSPVILDLRFGTGSLRQSSHAHEKRHEQTNQYWEAWADKLVLPELNRDMVRRSALLLKGLFQRPTGAFAAASTTSLPESIGGVRNWDYRFTWLRDSSMTASSLVRLGSTNEALRYLDWVLQVVKRCDSPEKLQPLYTVSGEPPFPEAEIGELSGYLGSRPVRIGNGAAQQVQLDVFGAVIRLIALLIEMDAPINADHWRLVEHMVSAVANRWQEPDHGIWEIRGPWRQHVHSKTMCWATVDRAITIGEHFNGKTNADWIKLRDLIAADVLEHGYKKALNAYTAAYDGMDLDASTLYIGLTGLLAPDDPRFAGTVAAIEDELFTDPILYRYHQDDGLPGTEGGFLICSSWLVDCYILMGRLQEARSLYDKIVELAGPTGLLTEEYDPINRICLGNVPQAYSHIGLIDNTIRLEEAGA